MAISTSLCPNFTGAGHDNSRLSFVPWQLHGAHLHPLRRLGSDLEKAPAPAKWGEYEAGLKNSDKRYGVCLTRSRLFVLDIDTHNGIDGNRTLAKVLKKLNLKLATFTVATGTGGFHYYFQLPEALRDETIKKAVNLWPGVDVFPLGQQVVGPGSTRTLADGSIGRYEVSNDAPISAMPGKLATAILMRIAKVKDARQGERKKSKPTATNTYSPRIGGDLSDKQHAVMASMCQELSGALAGSRHSTILRVAFNAGAFFGPDARHTVLPEIQAAAVASGHDESCAMRDAEDSFEAGTAEWTPYFPDAASTSTTKSGTNLPKLNSEFFNEVNVARAFAATRGDELISVDEWNAWARYAKAGNWEKTKPAVIDSELMGWVADEVYPALKVKLQAAKKKADGKDSAAKEEHQKTADKLLAKASRFLNLPSCHNAARFVFGQVMRSSDIFDANPDVLLTSSGAVELRTARLRDPRPSDFFTKRTGIDYLPGASSPLWDEILGAFHPEVLPYLQVIIGQALTGYQPSDASVFFFSAGGSNGKSTFLDVISAIMGEYADAPDSSILSAGGADSFSRSVFKGLRMALLEETAEGQWLDDKIVKKLAGTDKMRASKKFQDEETFKVVTTVFITTNDLPQVSANDEGTWRRLKLFPMPFKYVAASDYNEETAPAHHRPRNPKLTRAKENAEILRAALAWAVDGARQWYANGEQEPAVPEIMEKARKEWRSRQDKIGYWWSEWIIADPDSFVLIPDLYETFKLSAKDSGREAGSKQKFLAALTSHALYEEAKAEYVKQQRAPSTGHSAYVPEKSSNPFDREAMPLSAQGARYFVKGIRFIRASDLPDNAEAPTTADALTEDVDDLEAISELEELFG